MKRIYSLIFVLFLLFIVSGCKDNKLTPTLSFDKEVLTINIGEEQSLSYSYENIEEPVFEFLMSIEQIVSIDNLGKIKGLNEGKVIVTIYESKSKITDTIEINVLKEELVPEVSFSLENLEIEIDEEVVLSFTHENMVSPVYSFVSSDTETVSVNNQGKIKGLKEGVSVITISIVGTDAFDTVTITVLEPLMTGPVYNITTNEELEYALAHIKDNDSLIINAVVTTDELVLNNVLLTINSNLTVKNLVSLSYVKILDSTGILNYTNDIKVSGNFEINNFNLIDNDVLLGSNSTITIKKDGLLGSVILEEESNNVLINNYGTINNVDLTNSKALNNKKIIINNYGVFRDSNTAIIINDETTPENTVIKSLGSYFWIEDTEKYTNWDILENGPRYTLRSIEGDTLEIFLNNKSGSLETVVNDYISLYDVINIETHIIIRTEYRSLTSDAFIYLSTLNMLQSVDLYNTTVAKNTIPDNAFKNVDTLTHIDLPKGVTTIGSKAFAGTGISKLLIPDSLVNVAVDAFGDYSVGDYSLKEVHTESLNPGGESFIKGFSPKTLFFVPEEARLEYIAEWVGFSAVVEYGFYYYGLYVFPEANLVDEYYIRELGEGIEIVLYDGGIKENLIPAEFNINGQIIPVVSIGNNAFRFVKNEDNLSVDILIPDSITRIGDSAFYEFKTIKSLDLNNVLYVGKNAFHLITYEFTIITSPNLEYIDDDAFNGLVRVTSIDLSKTVNLGERSLQNCQSLTEIYAPMLKNLGTSSISSCTQLLKVTLGAVEECGSWTISGSDKIVEWDFTHNENKVIQPAFGAGWTAINKSTVTIYCNSDVIDYFQAYYPKANVLTK